MMNSVESVSFLKRRNSSHSFLSSHHKNKKKNINCDGMSVQIPSYQAQGVGAEITKQTSGE